MNAPFSPTRKHASASTRIDATQQARLSLPDLSASRLNDYLEFDADISSAVNITPINPNDPAAVMAALSQMHPFAEILSYEGIEEQCRLGRGYELLAAYAPHMSEETELRRLRECFETPISSIKGIQDLESRAWAIILDSVYAEDEERRALIYSVKDAGIIGMLAQANLQPPMPRPRRVWPWWYRPWRRNRGPDPMPNLFDAFGVDWKVSAPKAQSTNALNVQTHCK